MCCIALPSVVKEMPNNHITVEFSRPRKVIDRVNQQEMVLINCRDTLDIAIQRPTSLLGARRELCKPNQLPVAIIDKSNPLVTDLVPSEMACFASSPGKINRTAVWISRDEIVDFLEYAANSGNTPPCQPLCTQPKRNAATHSTPPLRSSQKCRSQTSSRWPWPCWRYPYRGGLASTLSIRPTSPISDHQTWPQTWADVPL